MNQHDDKNALVYLLAGFGLGALIGALAGLLFAPKAGEETREELGEKLKDLKDKSEARISELKHKSEEWISEQKSKAQHALESAPADEAGA